MIRPRRPFALTPLTISPPRAAATMIGSSRWKVWLISLLPLSSLHFRTSIFRSDSIPSDGFPQLFILYRRLRDSLRKERLSPFCGNIACSHMEPYGRLSRCGSTFLIPPSSASEKCFEIDGAAALPFASVVLPPDCIANFHEGKKSTSKVPSAQGIQNLSDLLFTLPSRRESFYRRPPP